jgi:hypothetical protein
MNEMTTEQKKHLINLSITFGLKINGLVKQMIEDQNKMFLRFRKYGHNAMILTFSETGQFFVQEYHGLDTIDKGDYKSIRKHLTKQMRTLGSNPIWMGVTVFTDLSKWQEIGGIEQYTPGVILYSQTQLSTSRSLFLQDSNRRLIIQSKLNKKLELPREVDDLGILLPYNMHFS